MPAYPQGLSLAAQDWLELDSLGQPQPWPGFLFGPLSCLAPLIWPLLTGSGNCHPLWGGLWTWGLKDMPDPPVRFTESESLWGQVPRFLCQPGFA